MYVGSSRTNVGLRSKMCAYSERKGDQSVPKARGKGSWDHAANQTAKVEAKGRAHAPSRSFLCSANSRGGAGWGLILEEARSQFKDHGSPFKP